MEWVRIGFAVSGEQQISRAFQVYAHEAENMHDPLRRMLGVVQDAVEGQLDSEGASGLGFIWPPLSPRYGAWKAVHYPGRPILEREGLMRDALLDEVGLIVVGNRAIYQPPNWPYPDRPGGLGTAEVASVHDRGGGRVPQRKIVALTTAQKREAIDRVFSGWLNDLRRGPLWRGGTA